MSVLLMLSMSLQILKLLLSFLLLVLFQFGFLIFCVIVAGVGDIAVFVNVVVVVIGGGGGVATERSACCPAVSPFVDPLVGVATSVEFAFAGCNCFVRF